MSKTTAVLGSALFFVVAPAMLAGVIPGSITHWEFRLSFFLPSLAAARDAREFRADRLVSH